MQGNQIKSKVYRWQWKEIHDTGTRRSVTIESLSPRITPDLRELSFLMLTSAQQYVKFISYLQLKKIT